MSKSLLLSALAALTAVNVAAVAISLSTGSKAEVAGMARRDLYRDRDFRYAVEDIVKECTVDGSRISCP